MPPSETIEELMAQIEEATKEQSLPLIDQLCDALQDKVATVARLLLLACAYRPLLCRVRISRLSDFRNRD